MHKMCMAVFDVIGLLRTFFYNITVLSEVVFFLGLGNAAVFDGFGRTVADTGHAVGTLISPNWSLFMQRDVVQRTQLCAFSTANAFVRCEEIFCGQFIFAPDRIEGYRDERFEQKHMAGRKLSAGADRIDHGIELFGAFKNPLFGFLRREHRVGVACHVVAWHFEFGVAKITHLLFLEHGFGQHTGRAAVSSASENEIDVTEKVCSLRYLLKKRGISHT